MVMNNGNAHTSGITERIVAHLKREQKGLIGVLKSHGFFIAIGVGFRNRPYHPSTSNSVV
jgi:hypothetical protein